MVETPKLSSLAGELLRFFIYSFLLLGTTLSLILFFIGKLNPYYSAGLGFAVALGWVFFNIFWFKSKLEELLGRLLYVIEVLEEKHRGNVVIPVPLYEEVFEIVKNIRDLVTSFENRYKREIKSLEEQIDAISESTALILQALEKAEEGYVNVEFPKGLDPVGAIGQAIQLTLKKYQSRLLEIKHRLKFCEEELYRINTLLEEKGDKINLQEVKEGLEKIRSIEEEVRKSLEFIKEY